MANKWAGMAVGLVGGQVAGRVLSTFLSGGAGERLLARIDGRPLTPLEHRVLAQKWAGNIGKALSAASVALLFSQGGDDERAYAGTGQGTMNQRQVNWVQVLQRAAEILLAFGAIFKVVGQFLEDREKTAAETERAAAKRLA